jgi:hypothetical protein
MSNAIDNLTKPAVSITDNDLDNAGFTNSGKTKFKETVQDFSNQIFEKSVRYGDAEKGDGLEREITHDHITTASFNLSKTFGKKNKSNWLIAAQVGEYIFTGVAGVGGGNLKDQWGVITFGLGLGLAVILIVVRLTNNSKD